MTRCSSGNCTGYCGQITVTSDQCAKDNTHPMCPIFPRSTPLCFRVLFFQRKKRERRKRYKRCCNPQSQTPASHTRAKSLSDHMPHPMVAPPSDAVTTQSYPICGQTKGSRGMWMKCLDAPDDDTRVGGRQLRDDDKNETQHTATQ